MNPVDVTTLQQKVFIHLRMGKAQAQAAQDIGITRGAVSRITRKLVADGYLTKETTVKPYLYGQGPRASELDAIAVFAEKKVSASNDVAVYGTGVTTTSPTTSRVHTGRVHHCKVRWRVSKIGDKERINYHDGNVVYELPFLDKVPYLKRRGVSRTKGRLNTPIGEVSVELEETADKTHFYAHIPEIDLPEEDITNGRWKDLCDAKGQEIGNFIQKWGGWKFGLMELCPNWKPEFGFHDPRLFREAISNYTARNAKGDVWFSGSEGRAELETNRPEYASIMVDVPGSMYELKMQIRELNEMIHMLVDGQKGMVELEAIRLEREVAQNGGGPK